MPMAVVQRQTFGTLIIRGILQNTAEVNRVDSGVLQVTLSITRHRKIRVRVIHVRSHKEWLRIVDPCYMY